MLSTTIAFQIAKGSTELTEEERNAIPVIAKNFAKARAAGLGSIGVTTGIDSEK